MEHVGDVLKNKPENPPEIKQRERFFKIKKGFNVEDLYHIKEDELDKALYCHLTGSVGLFKKYGTISGKNIIEVTEDWHRALGYNREYKLKSEDFDIINAEFKDYPIAIMSATERVMFCIENKTPQLLGKFKSVAELSTAYTTLQLDKGNGEE